MALVLTVIEGMSIQIGKDVTVTILERRGGGYFRVAIQAPRSVEIIRSNAVKRDTPAKRSANGT